LSRSILIALCLLLALPTVTSAAATTA